MSALPSVASSPHSGADLIAALGGQADTLYAFFVGLPPEQFFDGHAGHWSPAQHAEHLVGVMRPLVFALQWPFMVQALQKARPLAGRVHAAGWTKARAEPRTYAQIRSDYSALLEQGAQAPRRYVPRYVPPGSARPSQAGLARSVQVAVFSLQETLRGWDDHHLDTLLLPHPLMGLLSVREMLFFTLYHNDHHLGGVQRRVQGRGG